jgi:hypothetical protein
MEPRMGTPVSDATAQDASFAKSKLKPSKHAG